ncbi:hypothetical protein LEP1GSC120_2094 [Leptospira santarosai str. 200702252]|nr:hypothetical protein LEP1GSC130_1189 [Leptospira santarosai str. 200403458]EMO98482.1 hypothetical protein LEP1GSC120_2094 [Leptospira santarosai str. 200702252]
MFQNSSFLLQKSLKPTYYLCVMDYLEFVGGLPFRGRILEVTFIFLFVCWDL